MQYVCKLIITHITIITIACSDVFWLSRPGVGLKSGEVLPTAGPALTGATQP